MTIRLMLGLLIFTMTSIANANMCDEHTSTIEKVAKISGKEMKNIQFPIQKQLLTATVTALGSIPDMVGYLVGRKDGYLILCVVTFEHQGEKNTCVASINVKPDNSVNVQVANCGKKSTKFFKEERFIDTTQVYGPSKNGGNSDKNTGVK